MKVLRYLPVPSDLPWIIISQLIMVLTVAHFSSVGHGVSKTEESKVREIEMPQKGIEQGNGTIYIIKMGENPNECIVSSVDRSKQYRIPIEKLEFTSLDGRPVVDLSLSEEKEKFLIAISQKFQLNNLNMAIAYSTNQGGLK